MHSPVAPACRPLNELPPATWREVTGILTDVDDTLTRAGALDPPAAAALQALADADVPVVAITGRPLGWSRPFARVWPVAAIVAENGAVMLRREGGGVAVDFAQDEATRRVNAERLRAAAAAILAAVPGAALARDSAGRVTDIAIDHAEFSHLGPAAIAAVVERMRVAGMNATVSSIHVNGWYGSHDKFSGACWAVRTLFGRDLAAERARWVYVGDSTNDQAMFAAFPLSVGVANLLNFADRLQTWPQAITRADRGAGFAEVAAAVLAARARHGDG